MNTENMQSERPTPETDREAASEIGMSSISPGWYVHADFARKLERERDEALEECRHLRDWKREMMIVDSEWDEVREYIRNHPDAKLGGSFAKITLQFINERDEALDEIKSMREAIKEAYEALDDVTTKLVGWHGLYENQIGKDDEEAFRKGDAALAKLQPFLA